MSATILLFSMLFGLSHCHDNDLGKYDSDASLYSDSLLAEGKTWCTEYKDTWPNSDRTIRYRVLCVGGDYFSSGKRYKRIMQSFVYLSPDSNKEIVKEHFLVPMREMGGTIYMLDTIKGVEYSIFDYGLSINDELSTYSVYDNAKTEMVGYVKDIYKQTTGSDGRQRMCYVFSDLSMNFTEEIGFTLYGSPFYEGIFTGSAVRFVCCHKSDGTCIYGEADHDCPLRKIHDTVNIGFCRMPVDNKIPICNLQGQSIALPAKGIHIIGGRKVLVK